VKADQVLKVTEPAAAGVAVSTTAKGKTP
jgi:hypothetical protein